MQLFAWFMLIATAIVLLVGAANGSIKDAEDFPAILYLAGVIALAVHTIF